MRLFLIRHAQSENNALPEQLRVEDPALTPLGHRQAQALAVWLSTSPVHVLVASPFRRALETVEYLRRELVVVPQVWTDLHEQGGCYAGHDPRYYQGRPGMNRQEILSNFPDYDVEAAIGDRGWWDSRPYESELQATQRARRVWDRILETYSRLDIEVGLVMHADFKRLLLQELFCDRERPPSGWNGIYNTAVTALKVDNSTVTLEHFNSVKHLEQDLHTA